MTETINYFQNNLLTLNYDKIHFLQLLTKKHNEITIKIFASNSIIANTNSTKFLGLIIDNTLSWRDHIVELTSKLNKACSAIRKIKPYVFGCLKNYLFFLCTLSYVIWYYFLGNSHYSNSIFKIKKRIIIIITNTSRRESCRPLYKQLQILSLQSQYVFSTITLLSRIELYFYQILKSMIQIHKSTTT